MSSKMKLKSNAGGSVSLVVDDTLATDETVQVGLYTSPDGSLWRLTVDNAGVITMVKVTP